MYSVVFLSCISFSNVDISRHAYFCRNAKMIYVLFSKLNYNTEHEMLKKIGLDPIVMQRVTGIEQCKLEAVLKDVRGSQQ